jgi:hypothetical protein
MVVRRKWIELHMMLILTLFLVSCASAEPRRACSNWTNLTWTGGRIIGPRSSYAPVSTCAPGAIEGQGTGSSLTWKPSGFAEAIDKENRSPQP